MTDSQTTPPSRTGRIPSALYVWVAILIFAAANSVVSLLVDLGAQNPVDGRNAITFCNVLFVGNLCACVLLFGVYRAQWRPETLRTLDWTDWASLVVLALLSSALAPALTFVALAETTVTNVVLVSRVEPPLFLVLSMIFLREKVDRWPLAGSALALVGVGTILLLEGGGSMLDVGRGEAFAAMGAAVLAVSTIISKQRLGRIPLGIFTVFRTALGAVIFFFAAIYLYGPEHFQDAFAPVLWQWMLVYGCIVVVVGQLCWFKGIGSTSSGAVSVASSFSPVAGVLFAFLLLGEQPGQPQFVGGAIILMGIAVPQIGRVFHQRRQEEAATDQTMLEHEGEVGFKGV